MLRFLTAFLVQVRPRPPLLTWKRVALPPLLALGRWRPGVGGRLWGRLLQPSDFPPQVSAHCDQNKMTNTNLAVVFGPNLLWAKDAAITLKAINPINTFTKFLLDHQEELFPSPNS